MQGVSVHSFESSPQCQVTLCMTDQCLPSVKLNILFSASACCVIFWPCKNALPLLTSLLTCAGGHDFRLEYRRLGELREALADVPFLALTATAAPRVRDDIMASLRLRANARRCWRALPQALVQLHQHKPAWRDVRSCLQLSGGLEASGADTLS